MNWVKNKWTSWRDIKQVMRLNQSSKASPKRKAWGQVASMLNSTKHFQKTWHQAFSNPSKEHSVREHLLMRSVRSVSIILIPKPDKHNKRTLQNISGIFFIDKGLKSSTKYSQTKSNIILKGLYPRNKWDLSQEWKSDSHMKTHQCNMERIKGEPQMISTDLEKAFF